MLWQKASATTVPTTRPASSRAHDSCSSVRIVVAPSRCLQNDAKSWRPTSERGGGVHGVEVERAEPGEHLRPRQRVQRPRRSRRCDRRSGAAAR